MAIVGAFDLTTFPIPADTPPHTIHSKNFVFFALSRCKFRNNCVRQ